MIKWINEQILDSVQLDSLVALLEDLQDEWHPEAIEFAHKLADEIHSCTLDIEIEHKQPWFMNDKRNRAASDEPKYEREHVWLQRFMHVCNPQPNVIHTPRRLDSPIRRKDL